MIKTLYRWSTQAILYLILFGVFYYVLLFSYLTVSTNWAVPYILTPENEKVISFQRDYIDRQYRLNEAKRLLNQSKIEFDNTKISFDIATKKISAFESIDYRNTIDNLSRLQKSATSLFEQISKLSKPENEIRVGIIDRSKYLSELVSRFDLDIKSVTVKIQEYQSIEMSIKIDEDFQKARVIVEHFQSEIVRIGVAIEDLQRIVNSLDSSIQYMKDSPMVYAMTNNVAIVFIPYTNVEDFKNISTIKACSFFIFWCRDVATIKSIRDSEQVAPHPILNKPLRGTYAILNMENINEAKETVLFARTPIIDAVTSIFKRIKG